MSTAWLELILECFKILVQPLRSRECSILTTLPAVFHDLLFCYMPSFSIRTVMHGQGDTQGWYRLRIRL